MKGTMRIGIDDTDSPGGMCTTYIGAVLVRRLSRAKIAVREARLVRLNPNVTFKTRGNAAVCLNAYGSPREAFRIACRVVEEYAEFPHENTNPGVVVSDGPLSPEFYWKTVQDFSTLEEALSILDGSGAYYRGYKNRRGLIGATAAVCSVFPDATYELLAYRGRQEWGKPRFVDRDSLFDAQAQTYPHTWDSVDMENDVVVCVPHTPDPVLFGIRGERPGWISLARERIHSERPALEQIWVTNQGTDAHLREGRIGFLNEGCSYVVPGTVCSMARTGKGGHVSIRIKDKANSVRCMAYEPTKGFRDIVRSLRPGDRLLVAGSYKSGSINLEKILVRSLADECVRKPPVCARCGKRMTSAGYMKGYKCRRCGGRAVDPEFISVPRGINTGWYEVPPSARRHLARPLCRGMPPETQGLMPDR